MRLVEFVTNALANRRRARMDRSQYAKLAAERHLELLKQKAQTPDRKLVRIEGYSPAARQRALNLVNRGPNGAA